MVIDELTQTVIGAAFKVYNTLGCGFLESVYDKSLMIELAKNGLRASSQEPINVVYEGHSVGDFYADILVDNRLILELKAVHSINSAHEVQLVNYLNATGIDNGLLINFGPKIDFKRKFRQYNQK